MAKTSASRCPSDRSRGWLLRSMPGTSRSRSPSHVPVARSASRSACAHSWATVSRYNRSAAFCGTSPTSARASAGESRSVSTTVPSSRRTPTVPRVRWPLPCSAHISVDLPDPLRPISATISPSRSDRSTWFTAVVRPKTTVSPHTVTAVASLGGRLAIGATSAVVGRRAGGAVAPRRSRSGAAARRASRTDSGSGDQPVNRPR